MKRTRPYVKGIRYEKDEFYRWLWWFHCPWCGSKSAAAVGHWFRLNQEARFHALYCGQRPSHYAN